MLASPLLLGEGFGEKPGYDGQVAALIVGGQDDGVLVGLGGHGGRIGCEGVAANWRSLAVRTNVKAWGDESKERTVDTRSYQEPWLDRYSKVLELDRVELKQRGTRTGARCPDT